jgi:hypothetical protein
MIADHLVRLDIHVEADRTGIGATLALVAGCNIGAGLPLHPLQKMTAPVTDQPALAG